MQTARCSIVALTLLGMMVHPSFVEAQSLSRQSAADLISKDALFQEGFEVPFAEARACQLSTDDFLSQQMTFFGNARFRTETQRIAAAIQGLQGLGVLTKTVMASNRGECPNSGKPEVTVTALTALGRKV